MRTQATSVFVIILTSATILIFSACFCIPKIVVCICSSGLERIRYSCEYQRYSWEEGSQLHILPSTCTRRKEDAMTTEDSYVRFVTECATLPPLTPGETLYWNGLSPASRGIDLMPAAVPGARLAMPAQEHPMAGPSVTLPRSCLALPQTSTIDWAMVAASMTFYLASGLLKP